MKVLVVGHRGMLGRDLAASAWPADWSVVGGSRPELDITQPASIRKTLQQGRPDVLVNAAAYTAVDAAETDAQTAFAVNRDGVASLAEACREAAIPLVHVSTDYVFAGYGTAPYSEEEPIAPLGVYGRSKAAGEEAVRHTHREHLIVRTSWLYGRHGQNFMLTIRRLARERDVLRVVADQFGCPTWSRDLAQTIVTMSCAVVEGRIAEGWGTYHVCGAGMASWYDFACAIVAEVRRYEPLRADRVVAIPTADYPTSARRPQYSVLDCQLLSQVFGVTPRPWRDSLRDCIQRLYTC